LLSNAVLRGLPPESEKNPAGKQYHRKKHLEETIRKQKGCKSLFYIMLWSIYNYHKTYGAILRLYGLYTVGGHPSIFSINDKNNN
jgi:hypothetical protein